MPLHPDAGENRDCQGGGGLVRAAQTLEVDGEDVYVVSASGDDEVVAVQPRQVCGLPGGCAGDGAYRRLNNGLLWPLPLPRIYLLMVLKGDVPTGNQFGKGRPMLLSRHSLAMPRLLKPC